MALKEKSCVSATVTSNLKVDDKIAFDLYLNEVFEDLLKRRVKNQNDKSINLKNKNIIGINKLIFNNYYSLPGIIGERLFHVFDSKRKDIIELSFFKYGMNTLFCDNYLNILRFIFDFYDFDGDGKISKEDIRTVLSYVQFSNKKKVNNNNNDNNSNSEINSGTDMNKSLNMKKLYENSVKSQNQLVDIIEKCFKNMGELIKFDKFINIVENIDSEIFFMIYNFLLKKRPFSKKTIELYKKTTIDTSTISTIDLNTREILPPESNYNMSTLNNKKYYNSTKSNSVISYPIKYNKEQNIKGKRLFISKNNYYNTVNVDKSENEICIGNTMNLLKTFYEFKLPKHILDSMEKMNKNAIKDEDDLLESEKNNFEGYLYKYSNGKMNKIWFKLLFKDLFFYREKTDIKHYGMHNLSGLYFIEEEKKNIEDKSYFAFAIIFPTRKHIYYCDNEADYQKWSEYLKIATKYSNLNDIFEIKETLGSGSFSLVKLGINKITNEKVAVKIMNKEKMNTTRLESARTEIEIMKICQHPNIIHFIDSNETEDKIYIFMEYCEGGTLYNFLKERNFILNEDLAVNIAHKICMAVYYFHSFGITHRDLKPENILMTSNDDKADIKILDFGLSKIIGPNEKCSEPYGTIIYCAPEIILDYPYTKNVDTWSIGVITYIMLYGNLPFFDKSRSKLVRLITRENPVFSGQNKVSEEAKNFVQRLLIKDQNKRMNIKEALEHKWFLKYNKEFINHRMKNKDKKNIFELYTSLNLTTNESNNK